MKTNKFSFTGKRQMSIIIAIALILSVVVISVVVDANKDVAFGGGTVIQYAFTGEVEKENLQEVLDDIISTPYTVQTGERIILDEEQTTEEQPEEEKPEVSDEVPEETEDEETIVALTNQLMVIRISGNKTLTSEEVVNISSTLQESYSENSIKLIASSYVSPILSQGVLIKLVVIVGLICLIAFIYIAQRFKTLNGSIAGVITVVNMLYVLLFTYGVYIALKLSLTTASFAVIIAAMVYSVVEIVIVLAQIKESRNLHDKKTTITSIANESLNQLFGKTTTIAIIVVITAGALGGYAFINNISSVVALIVPLAGGILFSMYSAMFFAIPIWTVVARERSPSKKAK